VKVENMNLTELGQSRIRRSCAKLCHAAGGELEQIQFPAGTHFCPDDGATPWRQTADQRSREAPNHIPDCGGSVVSNLTVSNGRLASYDGAGICVATSRQ
jgi:hypothetical protein